MDNDGNNIKENQTVTMGATGNPRLVSLQERKKFIEEALAKCNEELKQICLQEADLTGEIPREMPLEPGETPPLIRRRVGTTYQFTENLIKNSNNKDEVVTDLELQVQLHAHMAEAALDLANEQNFSKTLRRKHMADYQQHKIQYSVLQEKLEKEKLQQQQIEQHKQKKKPRPAEQDDNISVATSDHQNFPKNEMRHSLRSSKCSSDIDVERRYLNQNINSPYRNLSYIENSYPRYEENLSRGFYALSMNGYKDYMERKENHIFNYNTPQYTSHFQPVSYSMQPPNQYHQPITRPATVYNYSNIPHDYPITQVIKNHQSSPTILRQYRSSPSTNSPKLSHPEHNPNYRYSKPESFHTVNPHQIQPHQQYEQMNSGLGGYWKRLENGEMVWCNASPVDSTWQRDKRFGSLDRRKKKRLHKRLSPISNKSATLATVPFHVDHGRVAAVKSPQIINRRSQDNRQLIRTQSLGSVGGQTIDSVWQSDDNSSCESDNRSINEAAQTLRKNKQKEWKETSLDAPLSPTHSIVSRSHSALPSVISPEEQYVITPQQHIPPPPPIKPPLEIPAESNPSPRLPETNMELFNNNNIPKNCTLVQAGHFKPYHEETKPFEMADWYKYSTKFKKSPVKQPVETISQANVPKNLNETYDVNSIQNHNFSPGLSRLDNSNSLNSSFDISQLSNSNVAERFSDEMNAWYENRNIQISGSSKGKSTATLV